MEIVAADREVKLASKETDLIWALRAGGNRNFGVFTSITFNTQEMPKTFAAHIFKI